MRYALLRIIFLAVAVWLVGGAGLPAAVISVNMSNQTNDANSVDSDETAVVGNPAGASISGAYWNNVAVRSDGSDGTWQDFHSGAAPITLIDDTGADAAELDTTVSQGDGWANFSDISSGAGRQATGDGGLMQSYVNFSGNETLTVSGLGAAFTDKAYKVVAYFDIGMTRTYGLKVDDGNVQAEYWTADTAGVDSDPGNDGVMNWVRTQATTSADAVADANYAVFHGLSGDSFTISGSAIGGRSCMSGFQVIAEPEPILGTRALVDLNDSQGIPASPDANGNHWNTLTALDAPIGLIDDTGGTTGWTLAASSGGPDSGFTGHLIENGPAPGDFDIAEVFRDGMYDNNHTAGNTLEFTLDNLDVNMPYLLTLYGERDGGWADGDLLVTTGTAADGPSFTLEKGIPLVLKIHADAAGMFAFTLDDSGSPGGNTVLNALSLQSVPEPSSLGLCVLAMFGALVASRRRRA
jgi:hypothetical protein